jgi:hypothetical protein
MPRRPSWLPLLLVFPLLACDRLPPQGWLPPGDADPGPLAARSLDFLRLATAAPDPGSPLSAIAVMEREARDPGYTVPAGTFPAGAWDPIFARIAALDDTTDFDLLYLLNAWLGYHDDPAVDPALWQKTEDAILGFKYWYSDPTPAGLIDDKWYWSENHQIIYFTLEYLAGQSFPNRVFTITGMTGAQHRARARARLLRWFDHKARFGFDEWDSNVYYQKDVTPLLTLVEYADDPEIATRAAMLLDRFLFDIALHTFRGAFGATHGRSYKKDKMTALDEDTFGLTKLLFDETEYAYPSTGDPGAILFARARRYHIPQVILDVAHATTPFADRERMGIALDELAPLSTSYPPPYGFAFTEENIDVYWSMGALTTWQVVPMVFEVADRYDLWDTELFQPYTAIRDAVGTATFAQVAAAGLARAASAGLNKEVNTYTWRTPDYMLSTAQDYRKGSRGDQYHSWQATFDANAQVFTTHPGEPPRTNTTWSDDGEPGSWTGTASQPRSAQYENVAIHLYAPQYQPMTGIFAPLTHYEPYTHAYFPQDHFDEVVRDGHWTFGRFRDGYIALYSWRIAEFVDHGPSVPTDGMTRPFDLVADGGPDDVWIVECGRAADWGSFAAFEEAVRSAPVQVTAVADGLPPGAIPPFFEVVYDSPSQGRIEFSWTGPLLVRGQEVPITGYPRWDDPWAHVPFQEKNLYLYDASTGAGLWQDFATPRRFPFHALP